MNLHNFTLPQGDEKYLLCCRYNSQKGPLHASLVKKVLLLKALSSTLFCVQFMFFWSGSNRITKINLVVLLRNSIVKKVTNYHSNAICYLRNVSTFLLLISRLLLKPFFRKLQNQHWEHQLISVWRVEIKVVDVVADINIRRETKLLNLPCPIHWFRISSSVPFSW